MITCQNITAYNHLQQPIFSKVGFTLMPSGAIIVKGANGAGKSRLLNIVAGIYQNYSGTVKWHSNSWPESIHMQYTNLPKMLLTQQLGYYDGETVDNFLTYHSKLYDNDVALAAAIKYLKLKSLLNTNINLLSSGQQQRLNLARLLLYRGKVWLLDEPEQSLDYSYQQLLLGLIKTRLADGGSAIIASHSNLFDGLGHCLHL